MKKISVLVFLTFLMLAGCKPTELPKTSGEQLSKESYGYQPLDPLPIDVYIGDSIINPLTKRVEILNALNDETLRLAVGEIVGGGQVSYGPATIGYEGQYYEIIIDYMKFQTKPITISYMKQTDVDPKNKGKVILNDLRKVVSESGYSFNAKDYRVLNSGGDSNRQLRVLPLYLGIGLRLKATIKVEDGKVDLGNLFGLGMAAQSKKITGSLIFQTLGISGDKISSLIPMPAEISPTSIQNAITALATIKSKMYDSSTIIVPRSIGFYNVIGGGTEVVNQLISTCLEEKAVLNLVE